jgi:hypothetical protein
MLAEAISVLLERAHAIGHIQELRRAEKQQPPILQIIVPLQSSLGARLAGTSSSTKHKVSETCSKRQNQMIDSEYTEHVIAGRVAQHTSCQKKPTSKKQLNNDFKMPGIQEPSNMAR